jgi:uncharacterized membrane protein YeaQ/YmgE (transglycosylase-associated protein family)
VTLGFILFILLWGFIIGGLARFAIPGPDPMPIWMTIAIGIGGSLIGGLVSRLLFGTGVSFFFAFLGAVLLVFLYRKYVQRRPIWGPGARQRPFG